MSKNNSKFKKKMKRLASDAGYIAGRKKFIEITEPTFKKAIAKAKSIIADYEYNRNFWCCRY